MTRWERLLWLTLVVLLAAIVAGPPHQRPHTGNRWVPTHITHD